VHRFAAVMVLLSCRESDLEERVGNQHQQLDEHANRIGAIERKGDVDVIKVAGELLTKGKQHDLEGPPGVFYCSYYKNQYILSLLRFYYHLFAELVHLYLVCWGHKRLFTIWLQGCLRETIFILCLPWIDKP
jgi:hypothetical protein